jgi:hypothetical protein
MRKNQKLYQSLAMLLVALMICATIVGQTDISARADSGNLADKAVAFLKSEYQAQGAQGGIGGIGPYDAYVLKSVGVDVSDWKYNDQSLLDAVTNLVNQDLSNPTAPVKHLAEDLIAMQELGNNSLVDQLKMLLQNRQNNDGSFQDDASVYSIIPAYELLGRAGQLSAVNSVVNAAYAQNYILEQQDTTTGAWPKDWPDFMVTAQAVRALNYLVPGAAADSAVGQAMARGCDWLKDQQQSDGSFLATQFDDPLMDAAEAILTQKALGLDPANAWTTDGQSAVDYLTKSALNDDGSFGFSRNTTDATWALDSLKLLGILPSGSGGSSGDKPSTNVNVRVRVEGITGPPVDTTVSVSGTALDALKQAVGSSNVAAPGGFINSINGEAGDPAGNPPTSWFYYVIRDGEIDPVAFGSGPDGYQIQNGDQVIFYIGAYDAASYANLTYFPVVSLTPEAPTAGQTITLSISAKKHDWEAGLLQDLSSAEAAAIGDYTVTVGETTYTSSNGLVVIPNVAAGNLSYVITNQNSAGYPNVVPCRGSINVAAGKRQRPSTFNLQREHSRGGQKRRNPLWADNRDRNLHQSMGTDSPGGPGCYWTALHYINQMGWLRGLRRRTGNSGMQGWMYTVNDTAPLGLAKDQVIASGDRVIWYYSQNIDQAAPTWAQLTSGRPLTPEVVTSTTGNAVVNPAAGGTVGLGNEVVVSIPAGALKGATGVPVTIQKVSTPPAAPTGFKLLGPVFKINVGDTSGYQFNEPVTLTFSLDLADLPEGETPSVYYYDETALEWVNLGGTVSEGTITVRIDHLTKFAVFIKDIQEEVPLPVPAQVFTDVQPSFWASEAINQLSGLGYISGYPDGTFKPDNQITRAELVCLLNKALGLSAYTPAVPDFRDVSAADWFYEAVENAVHAGLVKGYGNLFNPNDQIKREELATIMVNALGKHDEATASRNERTSFTDDLSLSDWARGFVVVAAKSELIKGYPDQSFKPRGGVTRAEACVIVTNFLTKIGEKSPSSTPQVQKKDESPVF